MSNDFVSTKIIPASVIKKHLSPKTTLCIMEIAYANAFLGVDVNPMKYSLALPGDNTEYHYINSMPSYLSSQQVAGIKWVSVFSANNKLNIPTVLGTIILNDDKSGAPLVILDGTYITNLRTAFSGVVPAKYCANPLSKTVTIIGPGANARYILSGISELFDIEIVYIIGRSLSSANQFCITLKELYRDTTFIALDNVDFESNNADMIFITTNSKVPVIKLNQFKKGAYVSSLTTLCDTGANILEYVDTITLDQPSAAVKRIKELSGIDISQSSCKISDIGEITAQGKNLFDPKRITLSIPIGMSLVDIALANFVYQQIKLDTSQLSIELYDF